MEADERAETTTDFVEGVRGVLGRFFRTAQLLVVISTFIGVIGIVNTQVATMLAPRMQPGTRSVD